MGPALSPRGMLRVGAAAIILLATVAATTPPASTAAGSPPPSSPWYHLDERGDVQVDLYYGWVGTSPARLRRGADAGGEPARRAGGVPRRARGGAAETVHVGDAGRLSDPDPLPDPCRRGPVGGAPVGGAGGRQDDLPAGPGHRPRWPRRLQPLRALGPPLPAQRPRRLPQPPAHGAHGRQVRPRLGAALLRAG